MKKSHYTTLTRKKILSEHTFNFDKIQVKARGGSGVKKKSFACVKFQSVMELLLFTESQNLQLRQKCGASKFGGIIQSHTK